MQSMKINKIFKCGLKKMDFPVPQGPFYCYLIMVLSYLKLWFSLQIDDHHGEDNNRNSKPLHSCDLLFQKPIRA